MSKIQVPFGFIEAGKIYLSAWGEHPDKEIGDVREEDNLASEKYFKDRFEKLLANVEDIENKISSSANKGSFLMKLKHMKDSLVNHCGLGDYASLAERIQNSIDQINQLVDQNRVRNTQIKKELIDELNEVFQIVNWREASEKANDVKHRWIKTGNGTSDENESLENSFWPKLKEFYARRDAFFEDKQRLQEFYENRYEELIENAKNLIAEGGDSDKITELKKLWSDNGNIDQEKYRELFSAFNNALRPAKIQSNQKEVLAAIQKEIIRSDNPDLKTVKYLQSKLKSIRTTNPADQSFRKDLFHELSKLHERIFAENLCRRRFNDFDKKDQAAKSTLLVQILEELTRRDETELAQFEDNSNRFNINNSQVSDHLKRKLNHLKQNILVKQSLIRELKVV